MATATPSSGFAPRNPTDGRKRGDWQSRYSPEAIKEIRLEVACVVPFLFVVPILLFLVWHGTPKTWFGIDDAQYATPKRFCYAWLGGTLGGTLFDLKWLIHSVAKGIWNLDRRLWRMLTPHMSGGLAFAVLVLISAGLFGEFASAGLSRGVVVLGVSFMVGYFSDRAIGKLAEVADTLFGATASEKEETKAESDQPDKTSPPPQPPK
jgi:hypothetical protein